MSITFVHELPSGGISSDDKGVRTLTRTYQVECTSQYDEHLAVLAATGVPRRGDFYVSTSGAVDLTLLVKTINAERQSDSRLHWHVTVNYSDKRDDGDEQQDPNPLNRPAIISRGFASFQKPVTKVKQLTAGSSDFGQEVPQHNSAGMPFVPPPMIDDDRYTVVITKNYPAFNDDFWRPYHNTINSNSFLGADEHTLKLRINEVPPKIVERVNDADVSYYAVTVELQYNPDTWHWQPLDEGFYEIVDAAQNDPALRFAEILDKNGQPRTTPALLDGSGAALDAGQPPVFLKFQTYKDKDFSALGLI